MPDDLTMNEVDALLEALRAAPDAAGDGGGMTAPELAGLLGISVEKVRDKLRVLIASGRAKPVKVQRPRLDTTVHRVPGYRIAS